MSDPKTNRRRGHPPFVPSEQQRAMVMHWIGGGLPADEVRLLIVNPETGRAISAPTFRRAFRHEIATGRAKLKADAVTKIGLLMRSRDERIALAATQTILKSQVPGWGERSALEVSGPGAGPVRVVVEFEDEDEPGKP
jgi:hypothetical protein